MNLPTNVKFIEDVYVFYKVTDSRHMCSLLLRNTNESVTQLVTSSYFH